MSIKNFSRKTLSFLAMIVVGVGCSGGGEDAGETDTAATGADASAGGSFTGIYGKVSFTGPRPERAAIDVEGDAICAAAHADQPLLSDREVVSEDGGVQWAFVYVKNPPEGDYPVPAEQAMIDQDGCRYTPHVLALQLGQELSVSNSDETLHNVHAVARKNKGFNWGQPKGTDPRTRVFKKAESEIRFKCDLHPWMTGFVFVMDHPFYAVTDENGKFQIDGLPAGEYEVEVWHEKYKKNRMTVTVVDGAAAEADFAYEPK